MADRRTVESVVEKTVKVYPLTLALSPLGRGNRLPSPSQGEGSEMRVSQHKR